MIMSNHFFTPASGRMMVPILSLTIILPSLFWGWGRSRGLSSKVSDTRRNAEAIARETSSAMLELMGVVLSVGVI